MRELIRKLGWLARRRRKDRVLSAELRFHLEAERPGGRDQTGEELGASVALRQTEEKFRTEVGRIVSGVL
jgi:hypothetical protein